MRPDVVNVSYIQALPSSFPLLPHNGLFSFFPQPLLWGMATVTVYLFIRHF